MKLQEVLSILDQNLNIIVISEGKAYEGLDDIPAMFLSRGVNKLLFTDKTVEIYLLPPTECRVKMSPNSDAFEVYPE